MPDTKLDLKHLLAKLKLNKEQQKMLMLTAVICLVVLYLDISIFLKVQFKSIQAAGQKTVKLKSDIDNFSQALQRQQTDLQRLKSKQTAPQKVKKIISAIDEPRLLNRISELANENNVSIMKIKPIKDEKAKDPKAPQVAAFAPLLIQLEIAGGYHQCASFINALENADEYMAIEEFKVTGVADNYMQQRINISLRSYVKK